MSPQLEQLFGAQTIILNMQRVQADKLFHPITLHSLRVNTVTNFDIYLKTNDSPPRFLLYRARDIVFTDRALQNLLDHGTEQLFIDVHDKRQYHQYLETNLEQILNDKKLDVREKARMAYTCATGLVEELLENPRSGEHIHRSKQLVSNLAEYLFTGSQAFFSLIATTSFDYYTYTHSVNVAIFGMALAQKLGVYKLPDISIIGSGLILHDIGKFAIDRSILNKKGPLSSGEWNIIRQHPENGVRILKDNSELSREALAIVAEHHEKLDGSGYPRGLRGDEIHPYARIAALADIFDALTTRRSYREAEKSFSALQIMRNEMLGGLDEELFKEFVLLLGPPRAANSLERTLRSRNPAEPQPERPRHDPLPK